MLETLRCPSCSTRFGLRASRVHAGIRRAQCFRCTTVFGIEEAVAHLLAPAHPAEPADLPPSLTLGDLEGADEEIMEKTMITAPPPVAEAGLDAPDSPYAASGPGFASAKDAIAKLMGAPLEPKPQRASLARPGAMDVEATLSALDDTLGGQRALEPPSPPPAAAPQATPTAPEPSHHAGSPMASTMKLTMSEIQAALAAAVPPRPPEPIITTVPNPAARIETASMPIPSLPMQDPSVAQDANLLKVQLDQEIYNNVTIEQMGAWVDEGRVHEFDMVARQFSEHWIEASKVPALRPIFEQRRRRQGAGQDEMPIPPTEILPQKKGLFGGLFSRN